MACYGGLMSASQNLKVTRERTESLDGRGTIFSETGVQKLSIDRLQGRETKNKKRLQIQGRKKLLSFFPFAKDGKALWETGLEFSYSS